MTFETEEEYNKPTIGTWKSMGQEKGMKFEMNKPEQVTFLSDEPVEKPSNYDDKEVYYEFSVRKIDGTESKIQTSAWTLLFELKKLVPLTGKTVQITKKQEKGKQSFVVVQIV